MHTCWHNCACLNTISASYMQVAANPRSLSIYLSIWLLYLPIYLSTCLSVCLPISLSICLSVCLSIYLFIYLCSWHSIFSNFYIEKKNDYSWLRCPECMGPISWTYCFFRFQFAFHHTNTETDQSFFSLLFLEQESLKTPPENFQGGTELVSWPGWNPPRPADSFSFWTRIPTRGSVAAARVGTVAISVSQSYGLVMVSS
jgi:hypothetical protein